MIEACTCTKFSQSAFTGFTNHLNRQIPFDAYVSKAGSSVTGESFYRVLCRIHRLPQEQPLPSWRILSRTYRALRSAPPQENAGSYLFLLPSDVLKMVTTAFVSSAQSGAS